MACDGCRLIKASRTGRRWSTYNCKERTPKPLLHVFNNLRARALRNRNTSALNGMVRVCLSSHKVTALMVTTGVLKAWLAKAFLRSFVFAHADVDKERDAHALWTCLSQDLSIIGPPLTCLLFFRIQVGNFALLKTTLGIRKQLTFSHHILLSVYGTSQRSNFGQCSVSQRGFQHDFSSSQSPQVSCFFSRISKNTRPSVRPSVSIPSVRAASTS